MPVKVVVDMHKCVGHSRCVAKAPEVYEVDDDGAAPSNGKIVPKALMEKAALGARVCPEYAISLITIEEGGE